MDETAGARRFPAPWRWPVWAVPAVLLVVQVAGSFAAQRQSGPWHEARAPFTPLDPLGVALLAAGPAVLLLRRRAPVRVAAAVGAVTVLYLLRAYTYGPVMLSALAAIVAAVTAGRRTVAWAGSAAFLAGYLSLTTLIGVDTAERGHTGALFPVDRPGLDGTAGSVGWVLVALVTGELLRATAQRAAAAARTRAEEARRRASDERLRMARELHDVLAHNISMINVRAGVALHLLDDDPEEARGALAAIKEASKEALTEMRSVIGALRADGEPAPRAPTAGLALLDDLVSRARAAGLDVTTRTRGAPRPLPAGADLAAFRIIQESLTNVTRHAGPPPVKVDVSLAYGADAVDVRVTDDGRGPSPLNDPPAGSGLLGMRERATALGGTFRAAPGPHGGFRVEATLPAP
ncbi:sensor histidine kinase [Actinomadura atramentaria]|uniref:sensor histidine kinase n=1 Tax=Actinomadura atramentaria TaxID=1990 RepID=UPI00036B07DF|nr:sensor histidine kinase [Actinomadura atramentaria]